MKNSLPLQVIGYINPSSILEFNITQQNNNKIEAYTMILTNYDEDNSIIDRMITNYSFDYSIH